MAATLAARRPVTESEPAQRTAQSTLLDGWTDAHTDTFRQAPMTFRHKLAETGMFSDEALINLLERHPHHLLDVCTMGSPDHPVYPNRFRTGDFRDVPARDLLDAAKAGRIWMNLRNAMNEHPDYTAVMDRMYGDLAEATHNKAFKPKGGILISSPVAKVPYHFDKTEVILWHVRGTKTVYVWPNNQTFIPDSAHESKLTNMLDDDLPYTAEFERHATVLRLQDGDGASWPLNAPHRVDNETFCVSVTTEYSTTESAIKNSAMMTNALLRRYLKMSPLYERDGAVSRRAKSVVGRVLKKTPLVGDTSEPDMVSFRIDGSAADFIVDVEPYERTF